MRSYFFLFFLALSWLFFHIDSVHAVQESSETRQSVGVEGQISGLEAIEARAKKLVSLCKDLPEIHHPRNSCDCLYEPYVSYGDRERQNILKLLEVEEKRLEDVTIRLSDSGGQGLVSAVQEYCIGMYGEPGDVITDGNGRTKAVLNGRVFTNPEEKTLMVNRQMELAQSTGGASNVYCKAYFEVAALEKLYSMDPLKGRTMEYLFKYLSTSPYCDPDGQKTPSALSP